MYLCLYIRYTRILEYLYGFTVDRKEGRNWPGMCDFFFTHLLLETTEKGMFYCITFLNFLNSDQGVPTNLERIKITPKWPTPPSIKGIWGFHDLTNFYKRFVPYFSIIVAQLIKLVRNHVPSWEDA